jgi:hypothetical protein
MALKSTKGETAVIREVPHERAHYNLLLATNPNYFSNLANSPFKGVVKLIGNTTYEQIECVGLNPDLDLLDAIVQIKQSMGYSGDICTPGSLEFVRFYADYSSSGTWQDLGAANVRVHDVSGEKPLCYSVKLKLTDPVRHFCTLSNIIRIRAILSWNVEPPPNTPDYPPVWGNVLEANVQVRPSYRRVISEVFDGLKTPALSKEVAAALEMFDPSTVLDVAPKGLSVTERAQLYRKDKIPVHRYAFAELHEAATTPQTTILANTFANSVLGDVIPTVQDIDELLKIIFNPPSDTSYEEVKCVGLRPEDDSVAAVITIKRPSGYSGSLCHTGSPEYVGFWLQLDGTTTWEHLGTSAVQVHDLGATVSPHGVHYAISIPVDLTGHRQLCTSGPLTGTLRAVLQWSAPPSGPTSPPHWGNVEDCRVQLRPGDPDEAAQPLLIMLSEQDVGFINQSSGLYSDMTAFGSIVAIAGLYALDPTTPKEFKLEVKKEGVAFSSWQSLLDPIPVMYYKMSAGVFIDCDPVSFGFQLCHETLSPSVGPDPGWFEYKNSSTGRLVDSTLGYWHTKITDEGLWRVRATFRDAGDPLSAQQTNEVVVRIDNTVPTITASFDHSGTLCDKYAVGEDVKVNFTVSDVGSNPLVPDPTTSDFQHFSNINGSIISGGVIPGAGSIALSGGPFTNRGGSGAFTLHTTGGQVCGYAFRITATEHTIRGALSGASFNWSTGFNTFDLGFCLG